MEVFVFGANLSGRHGKGAAKDAVLHHGAVYGRGEGIQGQSYAIPTKDRNLMPLPLFEIREHVERFKRFAEINPEMTFNVTRVGTGYAGFADADIAPLFANAPPNVILPVAWGGTGFSW